ncbi:MAG: hypothetical protein EOR81_21730 [Mesorhizobium sp.]|nr:MAG: hypothetical protein EOR81_21730 [Mesorhizobium sp.]
MRSLRRCRPEQHPEQVARLVGVISDSSTGLPLWTSAREGAAIVDQAIADVTAGKVSDADIASFNDVVGGSDLSRQEKISASSSTLVPSLTCRNST